MRHLFVTNDFPPKTGGIESYLTALCLGFDPGDIAVVAPARKGHEAADADIPYRVFRVGGSYLRASAAVRAAVVSAATDHRADAIHVLQALPLGRLIPSLVRDAGVPVTVVAHGSEVLVPGRVPFVRRALRAVLCAAHLVLPVSAFTEHAVRRLTKGKANTAILHPCVDTDRFSLEISGSDVRAEHGLGGRFVVVFVSRLVKRKGAETLVRAMADVPNAIALIGGSGPEAAGLRRLVGRLGLQPRVVLAGAVPGDRLAEYYAAGDVFCMPCSDRYGGADTEGFGIVYIEAGASGLPSIAGRCGGSAEAVEDGVTGFVLDDADPTELARRIRHLQRDEGLRVRMGAAARDRVVRSFSPAAAAARLEAQVSRLH